MPKATQRRDVDRLMEGKERLLREQPALAESYNRFLHDWEQFSKSDLAKSKRPRAHSAFGTSFKTEP